MGFKDPLGQWIKNPESSWKIVGVVKNFIPGTPYDPVYPMAIQGPPKFNWFGTLSFRLNDKGVQSENLEKITKIFRKYNPSYPFNYYFVEVSYAAKFLGEQQFGKLAGIFAALTIFISCLGLFALAAYMAENRTKEIGVRKVLGASVSAITTLLSKDFLKLVFVAFVIASPVAWWLINHWLQNFSYRVGFSWWIFALTGVLSILIALATVSYQAIKAALMNPVKSLRSE
jgi:ABC-type antimicrobial peptide transport system permease subunit